MGKTAQSSFENTYNLPKKTMDNQTEQNLFLLINNKKTSQYIIKTLEVQLFIKVVKRVPSNCPTEKKACGQSGKENVIELN